VLWQCQVDNSSVYVLLERLLESLKFCFLDEPASALDPVSTSKLEDTLKAIENRLYYDYGYA
jgi:ABC-type uncharacterized transport system ATPase subunit